MREDGIRVLKQDWHRNGVSGAGFVVSLLEWPDSDAQIDGEPVEDLFVTISFASDSDMSAEDIDEYMRSHTAALNIAQLSEGLIKMHGESAAWRGADILGPVVVEAWHAGEEQRDAAWRDKFATLTTNYK